MTKAKPLPPLSLLREHFSYDPETGVVERIKASKHRPSDLGPVGTPDKHGYLVVKFQGKYIKLHRLAWLFQTGQAPPQKIDHENRNPSDNRWSNLRECTHQENMANCHRPRTNLPGVQPQGSRWRAQASSRIDHRSLGSYQSEAAAHAAYVDWHRGYYGEFSVYAAPSHRQPSPDRA